jgi:hypothetical protein
MYIYDFACACVYFVYFFSSMPVSSIYLFKARYDVMLCNIVIYDI